MQSEPKVQAPSSLASFRPLTLVHHRGEVTAPQVPPEVLFTLREQDLVIEFRVNRSEFHTNPLLKPDRSCWGLWEWDVVEVFVESGRDSDVQPIAAHRKYFEFQLSPLGQYFELEILEARKKWNTSYASGFKKRVFRRSETKEWIAEFVITLKSLGYSVESPLPIRGNAFAILGPSARRSYWALSLPPQDTPNFHLPSHFIDLPLVFPEGYR